MLVNIMQELLAVTSHRAIFALAHVCVMYSPSDTPWGNFKELF